MMRYMRMNDKGQGLLEYATMLIIVITALVGMRTYMVRSYNERLRSVGSWSPPELAAAGLESSPNHQYQAYYTDKKVGAASAAKSRGVLKGEDFGKASAEVTVSDGTSAELGAAALSNEAAWMGTE